MQNKQSQTQNNSECSGSLLARNQNEKIKKKLQDGKYLSQQMHRSPTPEEGLKAVSAKKVSTQNLHEAESQNKISDSCPPIQNEQSVDEASMPPAQFQAFMLVQADGKNINMGLSNVVPVTTNRTGSKENEDRALQSPLIFNSEQSQFFTKRKSGMSICENIIEIDPIDQITGAVAPELPPDVQPEPPSKSKRNHQIEMKNYDQKQHKERKRVDRWHEKQKPQQSRFHQQKLNINNLKYNLDLEREYQIDRKDPKEVNLQVNKDKCNRLNNFQKIIRQNAPKLSKDRSPQSVKDKLEFSIKNHRDTVTTTRVSNLSNYRRQETVKSGYGRIFPSFEINPEQLKLQEQLMNEFRFFEPNNAYHVVSPPRSVQNKQLNSKMIQTNDPYTSPKIKNRASGDMSPFSAPGGLMNGTPISQKKKISAQYVVDSKRWADQEDKMKKFFNCRQIQSRISRNDAISQRCHTLMDSDGQANPKSQQQPYRPFGRLPHFSLTRQSVQVEKPEYLKILESEMDTRKKQFRNFQGFKPTILSKRQSSKPNRPRNSLDLMQKSIKQESGEFKGQQDYRNKKMTKMNAQNNQQTTQTSSEHKEAKYSQKAPKQLPNRQIFVIDHLVSHSGDDRTEQIQQNHDVTQERTASIESKRTRIVSNDLEQQTFDDDMKMLRNETMSNTDLNLISEKLNKGLQCDENTEEYTLYESTQKTTNRDATKSDVKQKVKVPSLGLASLQQPPLQETVSSKEQKTSKPVRLVTQPQSNKNDQQLSDASVVQRFKKAKLTDLLDERGLQSLADKCQSVMNSRRQPEQSFRFKFANQSIINQTEKSQQRQAAPSSRQGDISNDGVARKQQTPNPIIRRIDLQRSTICEDSNLNAEMYRSWNGDQKFEFRNRFSKQGGPSIKKMSFSCQQATDRANKLAQLGIKSSDAGAPNLDEPPSGLPPNKIIFAGQAIDDKDLDFETCRERYKLNTGIERVIAGIQKSQIHSDARKLLKLPLFRNIQLKDLARSLADMKFDQLIDQMQLQIEEKKMEESRAKMQQPPSLQSSRRHRSFQLLDGSRPILDFLDDSICFEDQPKASNFKRPAQKGKPKVEQTDKIQDLSNLPPFKLIQTSQQSPKLHPFVQNGKHCRRDRFLNRSQNVNKDQMRLTRESLLFYTAQKFLKQLQDKDQITAWKTPTPTQFNIKRPQTVMNQDHFTELQTQSLIEGLRNTKGLDLNLNKEQKKRIQDLKQLQGLKKGHRDVFQRKNVRSSLTQQSHLINDQIKKNAQEFEDKMRKEQKGDKYVHHNEIISRHTQVLLDEFSPKSETYETQIDSLNKDFTNYSMAQNDRLQKVAGLGSIAGARPSKIGKHKTKIGARKDVSIAEKLKETALEINRRRKQMKIDLKLKQKGGADEEDFYSKFRCDQRDKILHDELEDDKLMEALQQQTMDRDLHNLIRLKIDQLSYIADPFKQTDTTLKTESVDSLNGDQNTYDRIENGSDLDDDNKESEQYEVNNAERNDYQYQSCQTEKEQEKDTPTSDQEKQDDKENSPVHFPQDDKLIITQEQKDRIKHLEGHNEEIKKEFSERVLSDQIYVLANKINSQILKEFDKLKKQGVYRRGQMVTFKFKRGSPSLDNKYEKRVAEVMDCLEKYFIDLHKLKQDIFEIQQAARDEQEKTNVFQQMTEQILQQHQFVLTNKVLYRKQLVKDGIKACDENIFRKKEEEKERKARDLEMIQNYILNGKNKSYVINRLYRQQINEAKTDIAKQLYQIYYKYHKSFQDRELRKKQSKELEAKNEERLKELKKRSEMLELDLDI